MDVESIRHEEANLRPSGDRTIRRTGWVERKVEVRAFVPRERGVRAADPRVIGRVVLARCQGHPEDITIDLQRGLKVRDVQDNENESVVALHLISVLPSNGFAVQLPAHPLTGLPKPPRVAARIHRLLTGAGRAGWIAAGTTPEERFHAA